MNIKSIINQSNNYQDFHDLLSPLTEKQKGDLFEEFCILIFKFHPFYKNITKEAYLLKDVPLQILDKLNLPINDIGIDVIIVTKDDKYYAIQVKFRSNREVNIDYNQLGTFVGTSFGIANNIEQAFYFSNTYTLNKNIKRSKIIPIYGEFFDNLPDNLFINIKNYFTRQNNNHNIILPRPYQTIIIDASVDYFKTNDIGHLEMMCGTGKSLTSYWIDKKLNNKLTIILVPSLYLLSQFYKSYCYQMSDENANCKFILVGSDMDVDEENIGENVGLLLSTDPKKICLGIKPEEKTIIISTYQSSNKLFDSLKKFKLNVDLCIFDEAHKTVGNICKKWNLMVTTKEIIIKKKLFMTATPKIYNYGKNINRNEKNEILVEEKNKNQGLQVLSMCNEQIYGKLIYKYSADKAIKEGYLNDYKIVTLYTDNQYIENYLNKKKYVRIADIDNTLYTNYLATALMIFQVFDEDDYGHLVTYHNSINNAKIFLNVLESLKAHYKFAHNINLQQLDGTNSMCMRNKIINDFKKAKFGVICSCRALNEGVDIPIINSECFVDDRNSTIDIVQCIGRGLRLYPGKGITKILIPIILEDTNIDSTKFGNVIRVLKSLNNTDSRIVEYFKLGNVATAPNNTTKITNLITTKNYNSNNFVIKPEDLNVWKEGIKTVLWKNVDNFEYMYVKLVDYVKLNGKLPSSSDKNDASKEIRIWCTRMKEKYVQNKLSLDKIHKLNRIKFWIWAKEKVMQCPNCDKIFKRSKLLAIHINKNRCSQGFKCEFCYRNLKTKASLSTHKSQYCKKNPKRKQIEFFDQELSDEGEGEGEGEGENDINKQTIDSNKSKDNINEQTIYENKIKDNINEQKIYENKTEDNINEQIITQTEFKDNINEDKKISLCEHKNISNEILKILLAIQKEQKELKEEMKFMRSEFAKRKW